MTLKKILRLMKEKYPTGSLLIYDDGSGRITENPANPYHNEDDVLFEFKELEELISHLQEN